MLAVPELEIARHLPESGCSIEAAESYTRWLATHHYENFHVASFLLPRRLHQNFYNVYAYCRWADDLGDEIPGKARTIVLLDAWDEEVGRCFAGDATHPVLIALARTVRECEIPVEPFRNLLHAFRQDQMVQRYSSWEEVLEYCRYSANPVGRIVLCLCGYRDAERQRLSDATCTALQLANFWQDVARDLEKGRIYMPLAVAAAHGVSEQQIVRKEFSSHFAALMDDLVGRTRALFAMGAPLAASVGPDLCVDIELFSRGGLAVLDGVESFGYDTLNHRPALGRRTRLVLVGRALTRKLADAFRPGSGIAGHEPTSLADRHV
jgi:squalene synthase HpnC